MQFPRGLRIKIDLNDNPHRDLEGRSPNNMKKKSGCAYVRKVSG